MNRYQKQNEYYRKSVALANMQFIPTTLEVGKRNKEMQTDFYNRGQFLKHLNRAIDNKKLEKR